MRPEPVDDPAIQSVEAHADMGAAVVVAPAADDRVDRIDQRTHGQRDFPLRQGSDLVLEPVQRLLCGDCVEILPVQLGRDAVGGELKAALPTTDLKS